MRKNLFTGICFSLIALVVLAGCSNPGDRIKNDASSTTDSNPVPTQNPQRSDVTFKNGNDQLVALDDLVGKVVFINFWATWCPPCIHEMPSIQTLKNEFEGNDGLIFLMVDVDGKYEQAQAFMDQRDFDLPVYVPHSDIPGQLLGGAIPTTVILDKKGAIAARIEGSRDYADPAIVNGIRQLITE